MSSFKVKKYKTMGMLRWILEMDDAEKINDARDLVVTAVRNNLLGEHGAHLLFNAIAYKRKHAG